MALVDSLLSAIVRADGDALVMHVGERPYVVVGLQTINISTHGLNLEAMTGMLSQLLPRESQSQLEEFGAVEYRVPQQGEDRFSVVAARGGDDIWIEIRRRRPAPVVTQPQTSSATEPPHTREIAVAAEAAPETVATPHGLTVSAPHAEAPAVVEPPVLAETPAVAEAPEIAEAPAIGEAQADAAPEPIAEPVAAPPVAEVPVAEPPIAPPLEQPFVEPVSQEPVAEPATVTPIEEPALEVIEEEQEEEVVAVAEQTLAETTVETPAFTEAAAHQPQTEWQPPVAASIETPRIETPQVELPVVDMPLPTPTPFAGVVVPLTRTVRIEVPPRSAPTRPPSGVDRLLRLAASRGATALFLTSESRPWMRLEGDLRYLDSEAPLSRADVESAILEIAPESSRESIGRGEATEWVAEFENVGRIRCTTFTDHRGPGVLLRLIATKAATAEQLGLAREVQALATESQGLVLVSGPRASGKSTLLSALVDLVNRQRAEYVITLERQIRLVHDNKQALVSQREIRGVADDSVAAVRAALREGPDVLVVDDLVSPAMVPLLLTAASDGLLIFVSITAPSTADAVARFVELAPPEMRKAVQNAMAESFRGAVGQVLLKKAAGGVLAAREVLLATAPVTRVISEGQLAQLPLTLESGRTHGMVAFNDALVDLVRSGTVDIREAFRKAHDRDRLLESLKGEGIDTTAVERLA